MPTAAVLDPAKPPATTTTVIWSSAVTPTSPAAVIVDAPVTAASTVFTTTLTDTEPPRANCFPRAPPSVTPTSTSSASALMITVDPVEASVDPSTPAVTESKMRLIPTAAPAAACSVETASPPPRATEISRSSACSVNAAEAWTVLSATCASIVLTNRLMPTEAPMASFLEPAPATASETTVPVSWAVCVKLPTMVVRVEPSTAERTALSSTFTAIAAPMPRSFPIAKAPANE